MFLNGVGTTKYCIGSLGDIMQLKNIEKTKPNKLNNPKIKM